MPVLLSLRLKPSGKIVNAAAIACLWASVRGSGVTPSACTPVTETVDFEAVGRSMTSISANGSVPPAVLVAALPSVITPACGPASITGASFTLTTAMSAVFTSGE